ncbi:MAG TPA: RNA methyltransferase [Solirubrobacteraceae bacterium]|nr:RNA methyltransferase [Solirubrobacteraceae bacterium]
MTITSPHNEHLKSVRKLNQRRRERERAGRFVAEGEDLLAAADAAGWQPLERYCAAGSGLLGTEVEPRVLAAVSELGSGTRTLAVYAERWAPAPAGPLCVYLHGVQDPGNVGTILRSAEAFGAASVAIGPGTADPFGPKAVRASMGSVFAVPVARAESPGAAELAALPGRSVALAADADTPLHQLALDGELTLLIGAERTGLPGEIVAVADHVARIPIATHSLNAAMAATVALYEASRMAR